MTPTAVYVAGCMASKKAPSRAGQGPWETRVGVTGFEPVSRLLLRIPFSYSHGSATCDVYTL